ncbi:MAG: M14 family zinc carboxypeptidase [Bacillota bacterium]
MDFNCNYPGSWRGEHRQPGAGPFPFSEPETRAVGEFSLAHSNIAGAMSYQTTGGVILRPRCTAPDSDIPGHDLEALRGLGRCGTELTGHPVVSIFEGFTADKRRLPVGSFIDFVHEDQGVLV